MGYGDPTFRNIQVPDRVPPRVIGHRNKTGSRLAETVSGEQLTQPVLEPLRRQSIPTVQYVAQMCSRRASDSPGGKHVRKPEVALHDARLSCIKQRAHLTGASRHMARVPIVPPKIHNMNIQQPVTWIDVFTGSQYRDLIAHLGIGRIQPGDQIGQQTLRATDVQVRDQMQDAHGFSR